MAKRNKYTLDEVRSFAQDKGGECLSNVYHNMNMPMVWKCDNPNHKKWEMPFNNMIKGSWCPECRIERFVLPLKEKIAKNGGEWIGGEYKNSYTKIKLRCDQGHEWEVTPNQVMLGHWCAKCAHERKKEESSKSLYEIVKTKNGSVIEFDGNGSRGKALIRCDKGHIFAITQSHVHSGQWCPQCSIERRMADLEEFKNIAISRGGKCLSENYSGAHSKLKFQCANGHIWKAKPNSIKNGTWCPECNTSVGENLVRLILEQIFGSCFPKSYPPWLKSDEGSQLELDGFCEDLEIAFEHQGVQHLLPKGMYSKSFERRITLDKKKRELCSLHGVRLIEIEQAGEKKEFSEILSEIKQECTRLGISLPEDLDLNGFDANAAYINDKSLELKKVQEIALQKGGACLSEIYGGHYFKLEFQCKNGHRWKTNPATIKRGRWCPTCARLNSKGRKPKYSLDDMITLAKNKGGKCITREFRSVSVKMEWECKNGHRWFAFPYSIIKGTWCKHCAASERNRRRANHSKP